jgi:S1-C subfamily serine protease
VLSSEREIEPASADYVLLSEDVALPPAGVLGVRMEGAAGGVRIASFAPGSAAEQAGLEAADVVTAVDGQRIATVADVRVALWDKKPGDRVAVEVNRRHRRKSAGLAVDVVLGAPRESAAGP